MRHRRRSSLPPRIQSSTDSSSNSPSDLRKAIYTTQVSQTDHVSFHLTDVTVNYLKSKSEFVALLASLVSRESTEDYTSEDGFGEHGSTQNTSTREQIEIRNYRHKRLTADFPVLCEYIKLKVLPLDQCKNPQIYSAEDGLKTLMMSTLSECFRTCLLSSTQHKQYYVMLQAIMRHLLDHCKWKELVDVLNDIPQSAIQSHYELVAVKDFMLCCLAQSQENCANDVRWEPWQYLLQISDPFTKVRAVLGTLTLWPVDVCVHLLRNCSQHHIPNMQLRTALMMKLEEVEVYEKVLHFQS